MKSNRIIFQIFATSVPVLSLCSCGNQNGNGKLVVGKGGNLKTIVIQDRMAKFSAENPDQDMVLMHPECIQWRNEDIFQNH